MESAIVITNNRQHLGRQQTPKPTLYIKESLYYRVYNQIIVFGLLYFFAIFLLIFVYSRGEAYLCIIEGIKQSTLKQKDASEMLRLYGQVWTINLIIDQCLAFFELISLFAIHHFCWPFFFTLLRFLYLAISLKQVIDPEIPEDDLVRHQLSYIYSSSFVYLRLFCNALLCCLLSVYLFKMYPCRPAIRSRHSKRPNSTFIYRIILLGLIIFTFIRFYAVVVLVEAKKTLGWTTTFPLSNFYFLHWTTNMHFEMTFFLLELVIFMVTLELNEFMLKLHFYGTIFFTFFRFVHFAINVKQAIVPEIPEEPLVRQVLFRIYSPGYVHLNLFFNAFLCCLLPVYIFKLCNRREAQGSKPTLTMIILP